MNTAIKKIIQLTTVLLIATSALMANDYLPSITLKNIPAEKKFSLEIEGLKETAKITLTDIKGEVLLSQDTKGHKAFVQIFNLNQLPAGEYFITVRTSLRETVQPITLTQNEVSVNTAQKREFYSPVIQVKESHLDVSLFNSRIGNVTVDIVNSDNNTVFQEKLENVLVVEKRYRLDQLPWGQYTIKVSTESNTYYKDFQVR